ncbi:MAG: AraC family transcriptional regulator [Steroidobacteraceae bacterium]
MVVSIGLAVAVNGTAFAQARRIAQAPAETAAAPADAATPPAAGASDAGNGAPAEGAAADSAAAAAESAPTEPQADTRGLDEEIQGLKKDVVDLNKDLFVLEEELLFPANTQVAVFVSMDVGEFFALDNVTLKIDQKEVANYLYTPREAEALLKGGVQRLYLGNLKVGEHELVAFFNGKGPNERDYKRGATLKFEKGIGAKYLELKINDRQKKQQPEFEIKDWE